MNLKDNALNVIVRFEGIDYGSYTPFPISEEDIEFLFHGAIEKYKELTTTA